MEKYEKKFAEQTLGGMIASLAGSCVVCWNSNILRIRLQ